MGQNPRNFIRHRSRWWIPAFVLLLGGVPDGASAQVRLPVPRLDSATIAQVALADKGMHAPQPLADSLIDDLLHTMLLKEPRWTLASAEGLFRDDMGTWNAPTFIEFPARSVILEQEWSRHATIVTDSASTRASRELPSSFYSFGPVLANGDLARVTWGFTHRVSGGFDRGNYFTSGSIYLRRNNGGWVVIYSEGVSS